MPDAKFAPTLIRHGDGYLAKRLRPDPKRKDCYMWEWLTHRGWRRVRGGSHSGRKPSDAVVLRVVTDA